MSDRHAPGYRSRWLKTPAGRYHSQKERARQRGIPWLFTFDSWAQVWSDSGKWTQRGDGRGKYCMARRGDAGPYSPENCVITKWECNSYAAARKSGVVKDGSRCHAYDPNIF